LAAESLIRHSASHVLAADFQYLQGLIERNYVGDGPLCDDLRQLLKAQFSCSEVVLTDSGTAALHLGLLALAAERPGRRRVPVSAYVCPEVISAIVRAGLEPVLADSRDDSLNLDMAHLGGLVDAQTLAIICTHIGGLPDDYATAASFGVPVISDCAQALGSLVAGRDVACDGVCVILSFGATKMLSAGGGGALLCRSESVAGTVANLARPELPVDEYRRRGFQVTWGQHMGDLTAGLAAAQVRRLAAIIERRRSIAESYERVLRARSDVTTVSEGTGVRANRFRYYFLSPEAPRWIKALRSKGIDARESISHVIPEYRGDMRAFPRLGSVSTMVVSVPIFPAMTAQQTETVVAALGAGPE
jgi:dTDP-4-amino-4,6-dideoxygalactose transaminase